MNEEFNIKLDSVVDKLDKMSDTMTIIQVSQGKMEVNVAEHIRRTGVAEENIAMIRLELKPIEEHVTQVRSITKFAMWIAGGIGALLIAIIIRFLK
jgi:hypothetical protein